MTHSFGADSEVGCLRTVLMHRPGPELRRITPRTRNLLRLDGLPWVARAQQEHDLLAEVLRGVGTEVIYLTELLQDVLEYSSARAEAIASVLANCELGNELADLVGRHLDSLRPEDMAFALVAGITHGELRTGRGLVYELLEPHDFVVEPLPNLVFSKDASTWIGDQVVVGNLSGARRRETDLLAVVYRHHPRFATLATPLYRADCGRLDCGDVVLLGPGVVAVGVGGQSSPASVEQLATHLLSGGYAGSVLAVPMTQRELQRAAQGMSQRGDECTFDTICTVLDTGIVLMTPALAFTLTALTMTLRGGEVRVSRPRPFLEAAALALGTDQVTVVDTGIGSLTSLRGQWDDGGNALAVGNRTIVCGERNVETNARLADEGFEVIAVPGGELGGVRGGPRCMCAPLLRDPAVVFDDRLASLDLGLPAVPQQAAASEAERVSRRGELAPLR